MVNRKLSQIIVDQCFKGKAIILLGARQVGKTTLLKNVMTQIGLPGIWLNADEADIIKELNEADTSTRLFQLIGKQNKLVIIDEAQQVQHIGRKIKLLYDTFPEIQVIATGSSAFELQNETNEALTGRKREFHLFPLSFDELSENTSLIEEKRLLEARLIYGSYPEVINHAGKEKEALQEIANSYLFKDILKLEGIRKSSIIEKLLQALSFQLGHEVNSNELARTVGNISTSTVEKYLDVLEKTYVIYKLPAFSRNFRNEIKKGKKYYFYDNGIRNVLIRNFQPTGLRPDLGVLWENYLLTERLKVLHYDRNICNRYFWRTLDQAEIDYLEEKDGMLHAYEFKWKKEKNRFPKSFLESYPENTTQLINKENYTSFVSDLNG